MQECNQNQPKAWERVLLLPTLRAGAAERARRDLPVPLDFPGPALVARFRGRPGTAALALAMWYLRLTRAALLTLMELPPTAAGTPQPPLPVPDAA